MIAPPARPHITRLHGTDYVDEFRWLQDRDNAEVQAYVRRENSFAEQQLEQVAGLQDEVLQEVNLLLDLRSFALLSCDCQ
jgi:protease II